MASKSGEKGKRLEREVKEFFNLAYDTLEFSRTPGSGAIMGQSNFQKNKGMEDDTKRVLGSDLICPSWFKFSVECKNYMDKPNYATIIKSSDAMLDYWLAEALFDSINLKQTPMLVFRTSRKGTFMVLPTMLIDTSKLKYYCNYNCFTIIGIEHFMSIKTEVLEWNGTKFDAIQQWMQQDEQVRYYLNNMLIQLLNIKDKKKSQAKITAVTTLLSQLDELNNEQKKTT